MLPFTNLLRAPLALAGIFLVFGAASNAQTFPQEVIHTGKSARHIGRIDLNADGLPDVIVSNSGEATISVLLQNANGGFDPPADYNAGGSPYAFAISDFNLDGRIDVVTADWSGNYSYVLLGAAGGAFGVAAPILVNGYSYSVAAGDWNADGKPDFAAGIYNSLKISRLLGSGNGAFGALNSISTAAKPSFITSADFTNDGKIDIAYESTQSSWLWILENNGSGGFAQKYQLSISQSSNVAAVGEYNNDGRLDVASSGYNSASLAIILSTATGFAGAYYISAGPGNSAYVGRSDVNLDGAPDLITGLNTGAAVLLGSGGGNFGAANFINTESTASELAALDVDHDTIPDLISVVPSIDGIVINKGLGGGFYSTLTKYSSGGQNALSCAAGDWNHDGVPDFAVTHYLSGDIGILRGTGGGAFGAPTVFPTGDGASYITSGDYNLDGNLDLIICNEAGMINANSVSLLWGDGQGNFYIFTNTPVTQFPYSGTECDLNMDGKLDFVTCNIGSNDLAVLLGDGVGNFAAPVYYTSNIHFPRSPACADFDGDGLPDIACANYQSASFSIYYGDGLGKLASHITIPTASFAGGLAAEDFNRDGIVELAVGTDTGVFVANSIGGFTYSVTPTALKDKAVFVTTADVTNDGNIDIIASHNYVGAVRIVVGDGTGNFTSYKTVAAEQSGIFTVSVSDLNSDGRADLVAPANMGTTFTPILNTNTQLFGDSPFGTGTRGCEGIVGISLGTSPNIGNSDLRFVITGAPAHSFGGIFVVNAGDAAGSDPFFLNLVFHVDLYNSTELITLDSRSDFEHTGVAFAGIPNYPTLAGNVFYAQAFWAEALTRQCSNGFAGLVSSRGLQFTILP